MKKRAVFQTLVLIFSLLFACHCTAHGMVIRHNVTALNAHRNLTNTQSNLTQNLDKLSAGYRINRVGDDAAGLAISEQMRAQIMGLNQSENDTGVTAGGSSAAQTAVSADKIITELAGSTSLTMTQQTIEDGRVTSRLSLYLNDAKAGDAVLITQQSDPLPQPAIFAAGDPDCPGLVVGLTDGVQNSNLVMVEQDQAAKAPVATLQFVISNNGIYLNDNFPATQIDNLGDVTFSGDGITNLTLLNRNGQLQDAFTIENISGELRSGGPQYLPLHNGIPVYDGITMEVGGTLQLEVADQRTMTIEQTNRIVSAINNTFEYRTRLEAAQLRLSLTVNHLDWEAPQNNTTDESRIRNTDIAEEMMAFTKNNILVQASQAMLNQANMVPQGVFALLQ